MKYSGAELTIKLLEKQGIKIISGIPGGTNLPLYDALYKSTIKHVLVRHEQAAGFIAQGMTRSSGKTAVCFATSGPGATNLLTAIADAKLDSIPIVAITGQVSYSTIGTDAFQEVDTYGLTMPITKHNFLVSSVEELLHVIPEAFKIAGEGRPGPVLVDIPKNVQLEKIEIDDWSKYESDLNDQKLYTNLNGKLSDETNTRLIEKAGKMINEAKKPLLYIGGGFVHSNSDKGKSAPELLYELAVKNSIPVTSTLMGLGCFPCKDDLYLGMLGMHGARYTNLVLNEIDLLLAFGTRFDDRAVGNVKKFCPNAAIIHIDVDEAEINKIKQTNIAIVEDITIALTKLIPLTNEDKRNEWMKYIEKMKKDYPFVTPNEKELYHPINFIKKISELAGDEAIVTTDVGQHQMWTAQSYPFNKPRKLLTSGGLGTMGFGLPAAIGAALENPDKRVICISGDGSILMNIQELATLADLNLNITIFIMNNGRLGLVRQQQELFYEGNYIASKFITNPDFITIGRGFGIKGYDLKDIENPENIIAEALSSEGPCIVNVPIQPELNVMPMVPPGGANHEMIHLLE